MISLRKISPCRRLLQISGSRHASYSPSSTNPVAFAEFGGFGNIFGFRSAPTAGSSRLLESSGPLSVFVDMDSLFANRDVGRTRVDPGSAVVIVDSVLMLMHGGMGVAAEDARLPA